LLIFIWVIVLREEEIKRHTSGQNRSVSGRTGWAGPELLTEQQIISRSDDNISPGLERNFCVTFVLL
jgi:hypothetical protein